MYIDEIIMPLVQKKIPFSSIQGVGAFQQIVDVVLTKLIRTMITMQISLI